ncbi:hypothetical protein CYLTODRAFT_458878 [Cylindrobasidium torrendii FP15055 ss-10]|uniref:CCHC-type domain-containing protein n=1 Tax=Cylindrobasidium torrendii FP15055 ss-10 TaxID=1314674 RepID=A0A0D7AWF9_9AGAR|nr:hypothetical protein CYLTODRAFT_458878 [Cylindrobasidium torrendii FP15055 ss-10]
MHPSLLLRSAARLPRFTLFSGPNCSLCDVAKAELAKVRQTRPFELDVINIQDAGQERWKRKYVYWIPALHLEGKEVVKGRWDAADPLSTSPWLQSGIYTPISHTALGQRDESQLQYTSCCFNCGSPDHQKSDCPLPWNNALIELTQRMYEFWSPPKRRGERIHVEGQDQRLEWLYAFIPGRISSDLLRDAVGPNDCPDWLKNMANWGYPPGWYSTCDPREAMRDRILSDTDPGDDLSVFVEPEDENEILQFPMLSALSPPKHEPAPCRWAQYPDTEFLYQALPLYTGYALPRLGEYSPPPPTYDVPPPPSVPPPKLPPPSSHPANLPPPCYVQHPVMPVKRILHGSNEPPWWFKTREVGEQSIPNNEEHNNEEADMDLSD